MTMDEELIKEVEQHSVIYNRQKYFLKSVGQGQYETKDEAWFSIAHKLNSDVETCKKRWKYLRERYVQQLKQGIPPSYEHLSRPYLEKMQFLDQHIQPRKSYRNVSNFLPSPNAPFSEYMDSRSNGSMHNSTYPNYPENLVSSIKVEPTTFQNYSTASNAPAMNQHHQQPLPAHAITQSVNSHPPSNHPTPHSGPGDTRENDGLHIPSSSSSLKSPLSSPQTADQQEMNDSMKRARLISNNIPRPSREAEDSSDNDEDTPLPMQQPSQSQHHGHLLDEGSRRRNFRAEQPPPNNDFLYSFYQKFMPPNQVRCSEQLLGELVTSELLKMSREKRKVAQRRILEVLFFDD